MNNQWNNRNNFGQNQQQYNQYNGYNGTNYNPYNQGIYDNNLNPYEDNGESWQQQNIYSNNQVYATNNMNASRNNRNNTRQYNHKNKGCLSGCLGVLIKFILFIVIVIVIIFGIIKAISIYQTKQAISEIEQNIVIDNPHVVDAPNMNNEQDIEGLTIRQKLEMGLSTNDESDTDGDGLTDKEEIEIYHTDPLKASTSGDSIPDGYKVLHNLDLNKQYNDQDIQKELFEKTDNIKLNTINVENYDNDIREVNYEISGIKSTKAYKISGYTGEVEIDFSSYIDNQADHFIFKIDNGMGQQVEKLKDKDGKVVFNIDETGCVVGIINNPESEQTNTVDGLLDKFGNLIDSNVKQEPEQGMVVMLPITALTGDLKIYVYEQQLFKSSQKDDSRYTRLETELNNIAQNQYFKTSVTGIKVNPIQYKIVKTLFKSFESGDMILDVVKEHGDQEAYQVVQENKSIIQKVIPFILCQYTFDNWNELIDELKNMENSEEQSENDQNDNDSEIVNLQDKIDYTTNFDVHRDAYCFPNIGTAISPGGNCAGLQMTAVQMFNGARYNQSDSGNYLEKDLSYDLNSVSGSDTDTLLDPGLYDYKDRKYWNENYPDLAQTAIDNIENASDREFVKFIGFKWAEANSKVSRQFQFFAGQKDWSIMKAYIEYFKSEDKVAYIAMNTPYAGHAILGYGLYQDENDEDVYYIRVWDNNFPDNMAISSKTGKQFKCDNRIKIERKHHLFGNDTFEWDYYPLPEVLDDYRFTQYTAFKSPHSKGNEMQTVFNASCLVLADENFNQIGEGSSD